MSVDENTLPSLFEGATHRRVDGGEPVKAVRWVKDGDDPRVERYPIDRRIYKGLLRVNEKKKLALKFGDWIVEDAAGRVYLEAPDRDGGLPETKYVEAVDDVEGEK